MVWMKPSFCVHLGAFRFVVLTCQECVCGSGGQWAGLETCGGYWNHVQAGNFIQKAAPKMGPPDGPAFTSAQIARAKTGAVWRTHFWGRLLYKIARLSMVSMTTNAFSRHVLQVAKPHSWQMYSLFTPFCRLWCWIWCDVDCYVRWMMLSVWYWVCDWVSNFGCDVEWVMSGVWCWVCDVGCVMSVCDVGCVMSRVWCWVCDVGGVMSDWGCDVECVMLNVWCQLCDIECVMLSVWCQLCDVECVISGCVMLSVWCQLCDIECVISGCVMFSVRCWVCDVECVFLSVWCWVCDLECVMLGVWEGRRRRSGGMRR